MTEPPAAPRARKWPVRVGLALAALTYLVYSSYGLCAPFFWGHHGYHGATYMLRARMSLRLHTLIPANWTGFDQPPLNALYFHHPIGYHHLFTLLVPIFGQHEWLARSVAVAGGLVALFALYVLVRAAWSREAGLLAVSVYVALPVITSFSVLTDPMLLAFACVSWALWAYGQLLERPSRRALVHAALAYGIGGLIMWESYFIAPFIALHALAYRFTARGRTLRLGKWSPLDLHTLVTGAVCTLTMAFHLWFTHHAKVWDEFLQSYSLRHSPPSAEWVIERHTQWLEILFGAPAVFVGVAWLVTFVARAAAGRARRRDLFPLTFLYVNTIYIYMFAEGSSVHLYRVFFFSGFFTLAVVDLIWDAQAGARRLGAPRLARAAVAVALAVLWLGVEAPHAYANLIESRDLMGTHGQGGYSPEQEKLLFGAEVTRLTKPTERVIIQSRQLGSRKEFWYYLDRSLDEISYLGDYARFRAAWPKSVLIFDERMLSVGERGVFRELLRAHPVTFYGRFALVDLRSSQPGARSFEFVPGKMSASYRWFVSAKYPPMHPERRAYLPGLCDAVSVGAPVARDEALPPPPADRKLETCYYNYLLARGEPAAQVEAARARATAGMTPIVGTRSLGRARLAAAQVTGSTLKVAFLSAGPEVGELRYRVVRGAQTSFVGRSNAMPPPNEWRVGHLYIDEVALPAGKGAPTIEAELWQNPPPPPQKAAPPPLQKAPPPPPANTPPLAKTQPPPGKLLAPGKAPPPPLVKAPLPPPKAPLPPPKAPPPPPPPPVRVIAAARVVP